MIIQDLIRQVKFEISQPQGVPWVMDTSEIHNGVDLIVVDDEGNNITRRIPVDFPIDGKVIKASYHYADYYHSFGNRISLYCKANDRQVVLYLCHLDGIFPPLLIPASPTGIVNAEQFHSVKKGDQAGWLGGTGSATAPHLHLGVRAYDTGEWLEVKEFIGGL